MASSSPHDQPIRSLFVSDVTRDIPPVVYLHEQSPAKLLDEVSEYIITGGWPEDHPHHKRVPSGIHEQYVRLLTQISREIDKPHGPQLPNAWISGFYGSGKSSFAKLLGLALDGAELPDGRSLAEALLARDTSPRAHELREAWAQLREKIDPIAAVFDVGGAARSDEHIHAVVVRQVQARLGYCTRSPHVALAELDLERDGHWSRFEEVCKHTFGKSWGELKDDSHAPARFSKLMAQLYPDVYGTDLDWNLRNSGIAVHGMSPEDATTILRDMLAHRAKGATLFLVIDEVSQYVLANTDRVEFLRAFASALGTSDLKGKIWLLALGQQKMEEDADDSFLVKTKDRFPPALRVHLAPTNIRDVVHKRLLQKTPEAEAELKALFERHRPDLKLYAYGCDAVTPDAFAEVYPMLPGHIDLLLKITSALRTRSTRAQGDDQAIRGLLQLLGELFREQKLADAGLGALVTLDQIYEVQHTALDADVQDSMARILHQCAEDASGLLTRVAKVVALLELIQEHQPTTVELVAQCLYDRVDRGNRVREIQDALEELRRRNLLGYSEKTGYKIQSTAAEEWERTRRDIAIPREDISERVQASLKYLMANPERPRFHGRPFPWAATFSDGRGVDQRPIMDSRDDAAVRVDFRYLRQSERIESAWVKRSDETALRDQLVWLGGNTGDVDDACRELARSQAMVRRYKPRRDSLNAARKLLLQQEENRVEELEAQVRQKVDACFLAGRMYFRGRPILPTDHGAAFATALSKVATRNLPDLFPHFVPVLIQPAELSQLLEPDLAGPSPKHIELGILSLDAGRYVPSCGGVVPRRVLDHIDAEGGLAGTSLLAHFGRPPYGYSADVVKACVAGLLRGSFIRVQPDGGAEITSFRDAGAKEVFDKDRDFRRASYFPAGDDDIGFQARAKICKFFKEALDHEMDREDHAIADAVASLFPARAQDLRDVFGRLDQLPGQAKDPEALVALRGVLDACIASSRHTQPTVRLVKKHLDALRDGIQALRQFRAELTDEAIAAVREAASVVDHQVTQLQGTVGLGEVADAAERVRAQLRSPRPWREIAGVRADLDAILATYASARLARLEWQEEQADAVRRSVKRRSGFSTLTGDQSHHVLRPITEALTSTTEAAVAPSLSELEATFQHRLRQAEQLANDRLDELLSHKKLVVKVNPKLRHREIETEAEVDALLAELRGRLLSHLKDGVRIRLTDDAP